MYVSDKNYVVSGIGTIGSNIGSVLAVITPKKVSSH